MNQTSRFSLEQMEGLVHEIAPRLRGSQLVAVRNQGAERLFFQFLERDGKHETLFFCFQSPFHRFHLLSRCALPTSSSAWQDLLEGLNLIEISLPSKDRVLQLSFGRKEVSRFFVAEFFPRSFNYYVLDQDRQILASFVQCETGIYAFPEPPPRNLEQSPILSNDLLEKKYLLLEKEREFLLEKEKWARALASREKKLENKLRSIEAQMELAQQWESWNHRGEMIKTILHTAPRDASEMKVYDWLRHKEVLLSFEKSPLDAMKDAFKKGRKLRLSLIPLHDFHKKLEKQIQDLLAFRGLLEAATDLQTVRSLVKKNDAMFSSRRGQPKALAPQAKRLHYREYFSAAGVPIWVGRTAKENHALTFQVARGNDWWLHVRGGSGAHVVIRCSHPPDEETLGDAAQLAIAHSALREEREAEVWISQRKYLSRSPRNPLGTVHVGKHKSRVVRRDPCRLKIILERRSQRGMV